MCEFTIKKLLKKKGIILHFLIVNILFISVNAFSWGEDCCFVTNIPPCKRILESRIKLQFKFFDYTCSSELSNTFLKNLDVFYSIDGGHSFIQLMTATTQDQQNNTWAWIIVKNKPNKEKLYLFYHDHLNRNYVTKYLEPSSSYRLEVENHYENIKQTWLTIFWHLSKDNVTHIRILATWNQGSNSVPYTNHEMLYPIKKNDATPDSKILNFSSFSPKQEKRIDGEINTVKAYRKENSIVVKEANNKKNQLYTSSGKQLKSILANMILLE